MTYHLPSALGNADACTPLKNAAKESSRVSLTMVRARNRKGSREKTRQLAQLQRDWGQPGENFDAMTRRWQAKAKADADAVRACATGGSATPGAAADAAADAAAPPAAPGAPAAPAAPAAEGGEGGGSAGGGKLLGLHWGIWAAGGAALLLGGAVLLRSRRKASAAGAS
jgi:hypothetical protein